jgi:protein arginine kinase
MSKWYIDKGPESDVVLSCRVRIARNFQEYPFPHRATSETRKRILERSTQAVFAGSSALSEQFRFVDYEALPEVEKQLMIEKHLVSKELLERPKETGVIIDRDESISIMLNEEDHIRIQCLGSGLQLEKLYYTANRLDDLIAETIPLAWDDQVGYLTCCPTNMGTGIRASAMLHLPALVMTGYIRGVLESVVKLGVAVRGLFGENTDATGNIFQISNQITLGKTETDIVAGVHSIALQIVEQERQLRFELLRQNGIRLEDKILRSYGILSHTRIISTEETLQRLSDVRLGVHLGLLPMLEETCLNELMLNIQPGSIQKNAGRALKPDARDMTRAEIIQQTLLGHCKPAGERDSEVAP